MWLERSPAWIRACHQHGSRTRMVARMYAHRPSAGFGAALGDGAGRRTAFVRTPRDWARTTGTLAWRAYGLSHFTSRPNQRHEVVIVSFYGQGETQEQRCRTAAS